MIREVMWSAWEKPGLGHLRLAVRKSGVVADGITLGVAEGRPFRLAYEVRCDAYWRVRATRVGIPGQSPKVELQLLRWRGLGAGGRHHPPYATALCASELNFLEPPRRSSQNLSSTRLAARPSSDSLTMGGYVPTKYKRLRNTIPRSALRGVHAAFRIGKGLARGYSLPRSLHSHAASETQNYSVCVRWSVSLLCSAKCCGRSEGIEVTWRRSRATRD